MTCLNCESLFCNITRSKIIKGLDNQDQVSTYVCLIIKSLDIQNQKFNNQINQYPKINSIITLGCRCLLPVCVCVLGFTRPVTDKHERITCWCVGWREWKILYLSITWTDLVPDWRRTQVVYECDLFNFVSCLDSCLEHQVPCNLWLSRPFLYSPSRDVSGVPGLE